MKKFAKFIFVVSFILFGTSINSSDSMKAKPLKKQCWYDHDGGCDSGGWTACGICDDDLEL